MPIVAKLDELGKPAWIALMILGFFIWWPLGLATLAFIIGRGRIPYSNGCGMSRWWGPADQMPCRDLVAAVAAAERQPSLRRIPPRHVAAPGRGGARVSEVSPVVSGWRRTRRSSISSWQSVAPAALPHRRKALTHHCRRRTEVFRSEN